MGWGYVFVDVGLDFLWSEGGDGKVYCAGWGLEGTPYGPADGFLLSFGSCGGVAVGVPSQGAP
jgi:hypothetical protein